MSVDGSGPKSPEAVDLTSWLRQGDVFATITVLPTVGGDGEVAPVATPHGVAVISQTCDAIRAATVQVAPVVHLAGPGLSDAAWGRSPRWAPLPVLGAHVFIRLDTVATIDKSLLREADRAAGVASLKAVRSLAQAIGRRYSRFAFPDDVNDWFRPLKDLVQDKARRPHSAAGAAFDRVRQIRIRSDNGWERAPYHLGVTFLLDVGELPFSDDLELDPELEQWLVGKDADAIATRLATVEPAEQERLWRALSEVWVERCARRGSSEVVASYSVDLATADEYSVSSYWDSEALDLDHLSGPTVAG